MALAENPKGSTARTDDKGSYVAYHRVCHNCQVELTSRNRAPCGSLKCKACTATKYRDQYQLNLKAASASGVKPPAQSKAKHPALERPAAIEGEAIHHAVNPERQRVHSLLTKFLLYPTNPATKDALLSGLVDYELKERFRFL